MFCSALKKTINTVECAQHILSQTTSQGLIHCHYCRYGQKLMATTGLYRFCLFEAEREKEFTHEGGATMEKEKIWSYQEIAELAGVPVKAVSNTIYRMRNGATPKKDNPKKIADTLAKHDIPLDMVRGNSDSQRLGIQPTVPEPSQPDTKEPRGNNHLFVEEPCNANGDVYEKTTAPVKVQPISESPIGTALGRVLDTLMEKGLLKQETTKEQEGTYAPLCRDNDLAVTVCGLSEFSTERLLQELKNRHPSATISISL